MNEDRVSLPGAAAQHRRGLALMATLGALLLTMVGLCCDTITVAGDYTGVLIAALLAAGASLSLLAFAFRNHPMLRRGILLVALLDVGVMLEAGARLASML